MSEPLTGELVAPEHNQGNISSHDWTKMVFMWESGAYTSDQIGRQFNRNASHLTVKFKRAGIVKGSKKDEYDRRLKEELETDISKNIGLRVEKASETNNEALDWSRALQGLAMRAVIDESKKKAPNYMALGSQLKSLETAMKVVTAGHENRRKALGLDKGEIVDPSALPQLIVMEMSDEDVQLEKIRAEEKQESEALSAEEMRLIVEDLVPETAEEVETRESKTADVRAKIKEEVAELRPGGNDKELLRGL